MNKVLAWLYPQWFIDEDKYDPYCPICTACGEDGCCQAICCQQHPHGFYCETYKRDLEFTYRMYHRLCSFVEAKGFSLDTPEFDKLRSETYDEVYGKV